MTNQSYIRVLTTLELFTKEHLQIKRFASDFPEQLPNFSSESEQYPILFVSPNNSIFKRNQNTFDLTIYCYDLIQDDRNNINTILSDTNTILNDLYIWLRDGEVSGLEILSDINCTPINNSLLDYVAGWQMKLIIEVDTYNVCEIPFNEEPVILDVVNNIIYSKYLTCETLSECSTIVNIENNLSSLTNTVNGFEQSIITALGYTPANDAEISLVGKSNDYNDLDNKPVIPTVITNHSELNLNDGTNPHGTTKTDVGLGNVPNLDTTNAVNNTHTHTNKSILDLITEPFTTSLKSLYDGAVTSINNLLLTGQRLITSGEITKLNNISGTNTGDETTLSIQTKRPLKTIEGQSLEGVGNIDLTKNDVGLSNVDNTSDLSKPISTATQTALDGKQSTLVSGTNIKTINGESLLGSGNLDISGTGGASTAKACRFELTNNIDLGVSPTGSVTVIDFDNSVFNTNSSVFVNNGSGTVTCTQSGSYLVTTSIVLESPLVSAITKSELGIRKNGTTIICATTDDTPIAVGQNVRSLTTSTIINLNANDTLQTVVNLFGTTANGRGLRLPSLLGTTATQVSNISIEKLEVGGLETLGYTPANKAGDTFTGNISATNLSGTNTGDETTLSIQTKRPLKTVKGESLEGNGDIYIPIITKTSELQNDGEDGINRFITAQDLPTIPTNTSYFNNDGSDGTSTYVETDELGAVAFSNDYNDLDNKPVIPTFFQISGISILSSGWSLVGGIYEYIYSNVNITISSIVDVIPDNSAFSIVSTAQLLPRVDSSNGSLKLYSNNLPSGDFTITIIINK